MKMGLLTKVECIELNRVKDSGLYCYDSIPSSETMLYELPEKSIDDGLFCHRYQTDQLMVTRGEMVVVFIHNRHHHYILLTEQSPSIIRIPPRVPHAVMNPTDDTCFYLNAVIRHHQPHPKDYQPIQRPFPFDMERVHSLVKSGKC